MRWTQMRAVVQPVQWRKGLDVTHLILYLHHLETTTDVTDTDLTPVKVNTSLFYSRFLPFYVLFKQANFYP